MESEAVDLIHGSSGEVMWKGTLKGKNFLTRL